MNTQLVDMLNTAIPNDCKNPENYPWYCCTPESTGLMESISNRLLDKRLVNHAEYCQHFVTQPWNVGKVHHLKLRCTIKGYDANVYVKAYGKLMEQGDFAGSRVARLLLRFYLFSALCPSPLLKDLLFQANHTPAHNVQSALAEIAVWDFKHPQLPNNDQIASASVIITEMLNDKRFNGYSMLGRLFDGAMQTEWKGRDQTSMYTMRFTILLISNLLCLHKKGRWPRCYSDNGRWNSCLDMKPDLLRVHLRTRFCRYTVHECHPLVPSRIAHAEFDRMNFENHVLRQRELFDRVRCRALALNLPFDSESAWAALDLTGARWTDKGGFDMRTKSFKEIKLPSPDKYHQIYNAAEVKIIQRLLVNLPILEGGRMQNCECDQCNTESKALSAHWFASLMDFCAVKLHRAENPSLDTLVEILELAVRASVTRLLMFWSISTRPTAWDRAAKWDRAIHVEALATVFLIVMVIINHPTYKSISDFFQNPVFEAFHTSDL